MAQSVFELFAKIGLDSSGFVQGLNNAKSMATKIGGGIKAGLGAIATASAAAFTAASAATTKFVSDSVKAGMDFDKSMSQVAATMGKTVDDMLDDIQTVEIRGEEFTGNLREYALKMGKETAFSAKEAADALNYMALAGYDTKTSMEMLPNVLNLAAAGDMELAAASDMVTDTQTAFGISLERTSQMVDEMAKAASTGNTSVSQLGDAFLTVGGLASELNGGYVKLSDGTKASVDGIQELEIALTAMANAGVKGSEAGTHMRNMLMKLSGPSEDGAKALEEMGVAVFDTSGNMRSLSGIFGDLSKSLDKMTQQEKIQTISNLFNARDLSSAEALLKAISQDWNAIGESILDSEGAAQKMADTQLDNLAGDMTLFSSAMEYAKIVISDSLSPELRKFVQFGTEGVQKLADAFADGGFKKALETLKPILKDGIGMITSLLPDAINVVTTLIDAAIENLPDILETALPALVTAISDVFTSLVEQIPKLLPAMSSVGQAVLEEIPNVLDTILQSIPELLDSMDGTGILDSLVQFFVDIANTLAKNAAPIAQALAKAVPAIINGLVESLPEIIGAVGTVFDALSDAILQDNGVLDALVEAVSSIIDGITDNIDPILLAVKDLTIKVLDKFLEPENFNKIVNSTGKILAKIVVGAAKVLGSFLGFNIDLGKTLGEAIGNALTSKEFYINLAEAWKSLGKGILEGFGLDMDEWDQYWEDLGGSVFDFIDGLETAIGDAIVNAATWGTDLIENFVNGISEGGSKLTKGIADVATSIVDFIGFSEPKKGPLSNFHTFAPDMIDLFVSGIEKSANKIGTVLSDVFTIDSLDNPVSGIEKSARNIDNMFAETFSTDRVRDFVSAVEKSTVEMDKAMASMFDMPDVQMQQKDNKSVSSSTIINFTQNNTSPESLDEYTIWRESQRAMDMMRMQLQGV